MKINNNVWSTSLLSIFLIINSGCSKKTDSQIAEITISQIYSTYPDDINETQTYKEREKDTLTNELRYENGVKEGQIVDNGIYNFLMPLVFTSKEDLRNLFPLIEHADVKITYKKCASSGRGKLIILREKNKTQTNDNFNYPVYTYANYWASYGFFDNIDDVCFKVDDTLNTQTTEYDYSSNTVVIPAQEIKDMLDGLGIPYE